MSNIEVFLNGMIASKEDNTETSDGSRVLLFVDGTDPKIEENKLALGTADAKGEFRAFIPTSTVGKTLTVRVRHPHLKPVEDKLVVNETGVFHTIRHLDDGVALEDMRGAPPEDLELYYQSSFGKIAEISRQKILKNTNRADYFLSRMPFIIWGILYFAFIITFAMDYFIFRDDFKGSFLNYWDGLYLSMITITTLGYGDLTPASTEMRLLTGLQSVVGVLLIGLVLNTLFRRD